MDQNELVVHAIEVLEREKIVYMLVGSFASGVYGEYRLTNDVDIVIEPTLPQIDALCAAFPNPPFYCSVPAARDALNRGGQFNILHPPTSMKIDFMIARRDAWGKMQVARRRREWVLPQLEGSIAAPEDVILGKLWYYAEGESEKHLRDIASMLKASDVEIDREYVAHWARELKLSEPWEAVLRRLSHHTA